MAEQEELSESLVTFILQEMLGSADIPTESRPGLLGDTFYLREHTEMIPVIHAVLRGLYQFIDQGEQLPAVIKSSLPWEVEVSPIGANRSERHFRTVNDGLNHVNAISERMSSYLRGMLDV